MLSTFPYSAGIQLAVRRRTSFLVPSRISVLARWGPGKGVVGLTRPEVVRVSQRLNHTLQTWFLWEQAAPLMLPGSLSSPRGRECHNLNITLISALVAIVVGTIEVITIIAMEFKLSGGLWDYFSGLDFGVLGGIIIGIFVVSWVASTIVYKVMKYDDIEVVVARPELERELISSGGQ